MHQLKAAFISGFMTALMVAVGVAIWQLIGAPGVLAHWTLLISAGAPMGFFVYVFVGNVARTGRNLWWMPAVGAVCSGLALATGAMPSALASAVVGVLLPLIYIHWYSRFGDRSSAILAVGKPLPDLPLQTLDGQTVSSHSMMSTPALWLFFRGNRCPLCMAQIKEVAAQYRALADRGVQVLLVSPQAEANSVALAKKFDAPMTFLKDTDNRAAKVHVVTEDHAIGETVDRLVVVVRLVVDVDAATGLYGVVTRGHTCTKAGELAIGALRHGWGRHAGDGSCDEKSCCLVHYILRFLTRDLCIAWTRKTVVPLASFINVTQQEYVALGTHYYGPGVCLPG